MGGGGLRRKKQLRISDILSSKQQHFPYQQVTTGSTGAPYSAWNTVIKGRKKCSKKRACRTAVGLGPVIFLDRFASSDFGFPFKSWGWFIKKKFFDLLNGFYLAWLCILQKSTIAPYKCGDFFFKIVCKAYQGSTIVSLISKRCITLVLEFQGGPKPSEAYQISKKGPNHFTLQ